MKLVNIADLKSAASRLAGSSPVPGTMGSPSFSRSWQETLCVQGLTRFNSHRCSTFPIDTRQGGQLLGRFCYVRTVGGTALGCSQPVRITSLLFNFLRCLRDLFRHTLPSSIAIEGLVMPASCYFTLNNQKVSALVCSGFGGVAAFSGNSQHIDNPSDTAVVGAGPIPKGRYYIITREPGGRLGRLRDFARYLV